MLPNGLDVASSDSPPVTRQDRHRAIFETIQSKGHVTISDLSQVLQVSEMTVRRDLALLEREGLVKRVYGGATSAVSLSYEPPFSVRAQKRADAKKRIGQSAASFIQEGQTVILDVGSTAVEVAKSLRGRQNITVLTPSLQIANTLADEPGITMMVSGGLLRRGERSLVGDLAKHAFEELIFDVFVMGIAGIHSEIGLTEYNLQDAQVKSAALKASRQCLVVADSSKLGKVAFAKICLLDRVSLLVTDGDSPDELEKLRSLGVSITVVSILPTTMLDLRNGGS